MREETIKNVRDLVAERTSAEVTIKKIEKNNESYSIGLIIEEAPKRVLPVIHIDEFVKDVEQGNITLDDAVKQILQIYVDIKRIRNIDHDFCPSKEYILKRVEYRLVNKELNKNRLKEILSKDFLDLAILYSVIVDKTENETSSFLIRNEMLKALEISLEELDKAARKNTEKSGFKIMRMTEIVEGLTGMKSEVLEEDYLMPMYVLTNKNNMNGANVMIYSKLFNDLSDQYGSNLYVLPSSIHEVIVIPAISNIDPEEMKTMVEDINRTVVAEEEILSGNIYKWSKETSEMSIVV